MRDLITKYKLIYKAFYYCKYVVYVNIILQLGFISIAIKLTYAYFWKVGRVVEGARLESVFTVKGNKGSNPFPSATYEWRFLKNCLITAKSLFMRGYATKHTFCYK